MHPRLRCPGKTNAVNEVGARWRHSSYVGRTGRNPSCQVAVRYEVDAASGRVHLTARYAGATDAPTLPAFGLEWTLPKQYENLRFYGLGPEETYHDRLHGGKLAFSSAPRPKTMHRIWCRRRPATMKTCVGPKCLTPKDTACVSARPAANISRRACCRTARSCWKRRPTRTSCRRSVTRSCACWPRKWAWAETIHGRAVHEQYQLPADRAYTLDVNLELF
mgnify:CR=1 FL=1